MVQYQPFKTLHNNMCQSNRSFKHFAVDFFGTGIIGVDLKQVGKL